MHTKIINLLMKDYCVDIHRDSFEMVIDIHRDSLEFWNGQRSSWVVLL